MALISIYMKLISIRTIDSDGHMKEQTAESFSRVLGEYLSD